MYAPFVQKVDNAIHWINLYPVPRSAIVIGFSYNYPLDSLLSGGYSAIQRLNNQGRPVARFFYAEVRSNEETDQMKLKGQVSWEAISSSLGLRRPSLSRGTGSTRPLLVYRHLTAVRCGFRAPTDGETSVSRGIWSGIYGKRQIQVDYFLK